MSESLVWSVRPPGHSDMGYTFCQKELWFATNTPCQDLLGRLSENIAACHKPHVRMPWVVSLLCKVPNVYPPGFTLPYVSSNQVVLLYQTAKSNSVSINYARCRD